MQADNSGNYSYGYSSDGTLVPYTNSQRDQMVGSGFGSGAFQAMLNQNEKNNSMAKDPSYNPWVLDANQLQKNSAYIPEDYFITGNNLGNNIMTGGTAPGSGRGIGNPNAGSSPLGTPSPSSGYPAMTNSYNLGAPPSQPTSPVGPLGPGGTPIQNSQPAAQHPVAGNPSDPKFATQALSQAVSDSGSRGFNPWSMQGEANARN